MLVRETANTKESVKETAVDVIDRILAHAVKMGASDIHCDPRAGDVLIRLRIDGVMEHAGTIPARFREEMIARLKILSGTRTDLHSVPQDGRWQADIGGGIFNIRISFMPTYRGENAVMRLLPGTQRKDVSLDELGFSKDHANAIALSLAKTSGLILVTGPTGSGKTTTLHACLSVKAKEPISVITLEDPVEYEIPGVRQVHIRNSHGVTFATGLRAILRQDPDVIMVGEIRDTETARIAVHTALTGHLVLSTLHTNSALEAIPRLMDMGVDNYLLASTLRLSIGQRLVRTTCKTCASKGCDGCRKTGYKGRTIINETLFIDQALKTKISSRAPISEYAEYARAQGFRSLLEDGMAKVESGITTREEVMRVLFE